ncbi:MAG: protease modulator HflC [Planctomycetia bacterium]|nr:protease modulator HflC [Planctomycetia bacterium]
MATPTQSDSPAISRRAARRLAALAAIALLAVVASTSLVFVDESEFVIVETLGRIVAVYDRTDSATGDRGLHVKLPWPIASVRRFDRRQQLYDPPGREMFTRDKKNVTVSSYVCWKIADPPAGDVALSDRPVVKFFRGLGSVETAEARLEARVRSALEIELGKVELTDLLHVATPDGGPSGESPLAKIARQALDQLKGQATAETNAERLGIELVDLRIKRINLPEGNRQAVYERMRTERERIAERYRSAGLAEKARIESQARRQSDALLSRAEADAERIRGQGEAEAIRILNEAHAQDPEFYEFQRTLATYSRVLSDKTTLVLSSGSRLFKLLTEGVPQPTLKKADSPVDSPTGDAAAPPKAAAKNETDPPPSDAARDQTGGQP